MAKHNLSKYKYDCLKFRGYKPCAPKKLCATCDEYEPWEQRVVIVKLGALGDVLRTTPILHAFRRKYPRAHITWVTKSNAKDMLETCPRINRLVYVDQSDQGGIMRLLAEEFDELHNYDKEDAAIGLASLIKAKQKFGFHMNSYGQMAPMNQGSEYSFDLGLSDELKFKHNTKTYQEATYECSELSAPKPMDPYDLTLTATDRATAGNVLSQAVGISEPKQNRKEIVIGLNTGSGRVFRTKQWLEEYFAELAVRLHKEMKAKVLLLGGADEDDRNKRLAAKLGNIATYPGCKFSIRQFAGILEQCDLVVTGDTLAMHLSLAVGTKTVTLFGSTCDQEVDMYAMGEKLVARPVCAPCYKNECDLPADEAMKCMKSILPQDVFGSVTRLLHPKTAL
jgi:ADP-heptose:LPS heptosyltransferase